MKPTNITCNPDLNQFFKVYFVFKAPKINKPNKVTVIAGIIPALDFQKKKTDQGMAAPMITDRAMMKDEKITSFLRE